VIRRPSTRDHVHGSAADLAELDRRLAGWRPDQVGTLLFVVDRGAADTASGRAAHGSGGRVLLIRKRRGHGAGKINGPGGKPEPGETPLACALRETREEVGVDAVDARLAAVLRFIDLEEDDWLGYVFVAHGHRGSPQVTAEAIPAWFPLSGLPFDHMWEDDRYWLPRVLDGQRLKGTFLFRHGRLLAHRLGALADPPGEEADGR
jgi:8-oxo-dGTP diphosphatase